MTEKYPSIEMALKPVEISSSQQIGKKILKNGATKELEKVHTATVDHSPTPPSLAIPERKHVSNERPGIIHKFHINSSKGYLIIGLYPNNQPAEIFIRLNLQDDLVRGMVDAWAISFSIALQYGVPLMTLVRQFMNNAFEPAGKTTNPQIPDALSLTAYITRFLALRFLQPDQLKTLGIEIPQLVSTAQSTIKFQ